MSQKLLAFYDYEGTLGTSIRRHYVQYVEALTRIRKQLALEALPELQPISEAEFLERMPIVKNVASLLPVEEAGLGSRMARALLARTHSEIIWEYSPSHMLLEEVIVGSLDALSTLSVVTDGVVVSYTRQSQTDFANHLQRLGIVASNRIKKERVLTVGADGATSQKAKSEAILRCFDADIRSQKMRGAMPLMIADAVDDLRAALDVGIGFVGVFQNGKSSESDFKAAIEIEKRSRGVDSLPVWLFPTIASPECVRFISSHADALR